MNQVSVTGPQLTGFTAKIYFWNRGWWSYLEGVVRFPHGAGHSSSTCRKNT